MLITKRSRLNLSKLSVNHNEIKRNEYFSEEIYKIDTSTKF